MADDDQVERGNARRGMAVDPKVGFKVYSPVMTPQPSSASARAGPYPSAGEDVIVPPASARLTGRALGLDIGGTGIKAAVVDLASGKLVTERVREPTPHPATRDAVLDVVTEVVGKLEATGVLTPDMAGGAGFPSVIRAGMAMTATHGDASWIRAPVREMLEERLDAGCS